VDAASKSTILSSDAIEKVLNSSSLNSTLSPVLEATPGAEIASEMGDVFTLPLTPDIDHERRHTAADSPPHAAAPTHAPVNVQAPAPAEPPASLVLPPPLGGGGRLGSRKELPPRGLPDANPLAGLPPLSQTHDGGPPPPGPAPMSAQALQSLGDTLVNALTGVINNDDHDMGSGVLSGGQGAPPPLGGGGALPPVDFPMEKESGPNRKEWAAGEDELILEAVKSLGCKWRQIASMLPGRSDDAVRNRWNRLKEPSSLVRAMPDASGTSGSSAYRCSKCGRLKKNHRCTYVPPDDKDKDKGDKGSRGDGGDGWGLDHDDEGGGGAEGHKEGKRKQERMGWTKAEDAMITRSVQELGHKWFLISERLPGRTDHAIRNRWHRLVTMRHDSHQADSYRFTGRLLPGGDSCAHSGAADFHDPPPFLPDPSANPAGGALAPFMHELTSGGADVDISELEKEMD